MRGKIARSAEEYDTAIRWQGRLKNERPFFEKIFREHHVDSVLDCACGTGRHALLFKKMGLQVQGFDVDEDMVRTARRNAREAKEKIRFFKADLKSFARSCKRKYAACISIGNSLSLAGPRSTLKSFLRNAARVLEVGGILMTQVINYRTIKEGKYTFVPPRIAGKGEEVFCLVKFFERRKERIFVNFVKAVKKKGALEQDHFRSELTPYYKADFEALLKRDFSVIGYFGNYQFGKFNARKSKDLIVVARRR
jgi:ubiquinone/menaquinone biosynthesis C-methylase UbiE